jgi:cold shock CspA family protein
MREQGRIRAYLETKGFGFIRPSNGGDDVFFHRTRCEIPELDLVRGLAVEYRLVEDRKQPGRFRAIDVTTDSSGAQGTR